MVSQSKKKIIPYIKQNRFVIALTAPTPIWDAETVRERIVPVIIQVIVTFGMVHG